MLPVQSILSIPPIILLHILLSKKLKYKLCQEEWISWIFLI